MMPLAAGRRTSDQRITRRSVIELGVPLLGMGLTDLLRIRAQGGETVTGTGADAGAAALARSGPAGVGRRKRSLIVFWTHGGMSQQDTYDLKPDAPAEYRGPYRPILTVAPGVSVTEKFPRQARIMDRLSIVRSVNHQNAIHAPSAHIMQTGYFGPTLARNAPHNPSFGSVISRTRASECAPMPAYVTVPNAEAFGYQGAVYLGAAYNPFEGGADPSDPNYSVPNLSLPEGLTLGGVEDRSKLLARFDTLRRDVDATGAIGGLDQFKAEAFEMLTGKNVRDAFDLAREDPRQRDRYGRHSYGQGALLARRLVEAGTACVTVNTGYWDHHDDIQPNLEDHLPPLDAAIAALVEDLDERSLLDEVVIYCAGEFGRTPLINGHAGRDHWSNCFSVLIGGGGLQGGRIVGASEPRGGKVQDQPVCPHDLLATIYKALDVPLDTHFRDASGRPVSIVGTGKPIAELF
jgi:hypothetical protein